MGQIIHSTLHVMWILMVSLLHTVISIGEEHAILIISYHVSYYIVRNKT
jgi:hypothetical protein